MSELIKIWIDTFRDGEKEKHNLRMDWDNDRHHAIELNSLNAKDVAEGLARASVRLRYELRQKKDNM